MLLPVRHDMDAGDTLDFPDLLDDFDAYAFAFIPLGMGGCLSQTLDDCIRDDNAGHPVSHEEGGALRSQWAYANQDKESFVKTQVANLCHELTKAFDVKAELGLDKVCPRL